MPLTWEELDSSLLGNSGIVCPFNLSIDNGVCRMVCNQVVSLFFWGFESHAGRGKCLLRGGWQLQRKKEEEWASSIWRNVSLQKQLESFGQERTQRDQKNPSKNHCPASRKHYYCLADKPYSIAEITMAAGLQCHGNSVVILPWQENLSEDPELGDLSDLP